MGFDGMCGMFDAEPTGEARQLYNAFVDPASGRVPVKRLLLALNNFTGTDKAQRVSFCFWLFDEDRSGSLEEGELLDILVANHMASGPEAVRSKAQVIMRQADKDGSGTIDLDEFIVVSQKFPNLLFPMHAQAGGNGVGGTASDFG